MFKLAKSKIRHEGHGPVGAAKGELEPGTYVIGPIYAEGKHLKRRLLAVGRATGLNEKGEPIDLGIRHTHATLTTDPAEEGLHVSLAIFAALSGHLAEERPEDGNHLLTVE